MLIAGIEDSIANLFTQPWFLGLIATVIGALWGLKFVVNFRQHVKETRWGRLFDFAKQAVTRTYHTYVQEIKAAREDGKLKPEEKAEARQRAMERLRSIAEQEVPGLLEHYGRAALEYLIERAVDFLKERAAPDPASTGGK